MHGWLVHVLGSGMIEVYDFCSPWDESARSTKCMIAKHLQIVVDALSIAECIRVIRNEKDLHIIYAQAEVTSLSYSLAALEACYC